jgi:hypothetical protein
MGKPMTAAQTKAQLTKWKIKTAYYPGWETRGRPGGIVDARGIVEHHTGGTGQSDAYLKFLFVTGRPDEGIPGPLCNVSTGADGTLHVGATGRANHAGRGSQATLNHVHNEDYPGYTSELSPGPDGINGNEYYYGNEIMYTGGAPMTDAAYRTAILHAAAICDFYGWSALSVIGHKEHTNRKDDPGHQAMNRFRTDLATVLRIGPSVVWTGKTPHPPAATPGTTPTPPKEVDDMAGEGPAILAALNKFIAAEAGRYSDLKDTLVGWMQDQEEKRAAADKARDDALAASVAALADAVAKLPKV